MLEGKYEENRFQKMLSTLHREIEVSKSKNKEMKKN